MSAIAGRWRNRDRVRELPGFQDDRAVIQIVALVDVVAPDVRRADLVESNRKFRPKVDVDTVHDRRLNRDLLPPAFRRPERGDVIRLRDRMLDRVALLRFAVGRVGQHAVLVARDVEADVNDLPGRNRKILSINQVRDQRARRGFDTHVIARPDLRDDDGRGDAEDHDDREDFHQGKAGAAPDPARPKARGRCCCRPTANPGFREHNSLRAGASSRSV